MSNQRKEERKKLMSFTPVYELPARTVIGYLGDLTMQGAMIVGEKPEQVDRKLTLSIDFHETLVTPATRMILPVRVAWCKKEEGSTFYNTGVEFQGLSDQNALVIRAILERYQFHREVPA
jgi:hypothetical protein